MVRRTLLAAGLGACALAPATAQAGSYEVYSCKVGSAFYRFERTTGPVRYRFRVKVVRQAGLPFQGGVSPIVLVSVRP